MQHYQPFYLILISFFGHNHPGKFCIFSNCLLTYERFDQHSFSFFCILLLIILPPVIFVFGARLSQPIKFLLLFHFPISVPISDIISKKDISLIPSTLLRSTPAIIFKRGRMSCLNSFLPDPFFLRKGRLYLHPLFLQHW